MVSFTGGLFSRCVCQKAHTVSLILGVDFGYRISSTVPFFTTDASLSSW